MIAIARRQGRRRFAWRRPPYEFERRRLPIDIGCGPAAIRRVGSIVEAPALFPRFSGRRNLEILGRIDGIGRIENRFVEDSA